MDQLPHIQNQLRAEIMITPFVMDDKNPLIATINAVCNSTPWMQTNHFVPTPSWQQVLTSPLQPGYLLLIAYHQQVLCGWCRLYPTLNNNYTALELGIGLLTPYRYQGIGGLLLDYAFHWVKNEEIKQILLKTQLQNRPAIHLFRKFGFAVTKIEKDRMMMEVDVG